MRRLFLATAIAVAAGCSSDTPPTTPVAASPSPASGASDTDAIRAAAERFLASVVAGDAAEAVRWLTPSAATRAKSDPTLIAPLGFPVASLEVAEVRMVTENEAAAQCWLSERDASEREEVCCLLKRAEAGWRVCGIACDAGPGKPPAVISFEPTSPKSPQWSNLNRFVEESTPDEVRSAAAPAGTTSR